jgi:haloalkane dehalogenase
VTRWQDRKRRHPIGDGLELAYVEEGEGPTVVLLHGNPTSSYLWRHTIPPLVAAGYRCVAPDLVGMGDSDRLPDTGPDAYTFAQHVEALDTFLAAQVPDAGAALVLHDWGSGLGFDWARRHPDLVRAIAYTEAIVTPVTWDDWPDAARDIFAAMRSEQGEDLVLERNVFVERILPASILRELSAEELDEYRRPYLDVGEARRPTLTWPRQIPIDGDPADVHDTVTAYGQWLAGSDVPKLFVNADPGSILTGRQREVCRTWRHQREVTVPGIHFVPEDSGELIGQHVAGLLDEVLPR